MSKFFMFNQNNSGGSFDVDEKLCHRIVFECENKDEAIILAEEKGCYWNGVIEGLDCPCCGDRWNTYCDEIDINEYSTEGYPVSVYDGIYKSTRGEWNRRFGSYEIIEKPTMQTRYSTTNYSGKIKFNNIEEYCQYLADEYGWTSPDCRIFYKDGRVKEIFKNK